MISLEGWQIMSLWECSRQGEPTQRMGRSIWVPRSSRLWCYTAELTLLSERYRVTVCFSAPLPIPCLGTRNIYRTISCCVMHNREGWFCVWGGWWAARFQAPAFWGANGLRDSRILGASPRLLWLLSLSFMWQRWSLGKKRIPHCIEEAPYEVG